MAWGFTNSYGDWTDLIVLEVDPRQPDVYRTPAGPKRFAKVTETIRVKESAGVSLEVKETIWGPVLGTITQGRPRAFAWTAHHPEAVNLTSPGSRTRARRLEEAMAVAHRSGVPPQNFVVGGRDRAGRLDDHGADAAPGRLYGPGPHLLGGRLPRLERLAPARARSRRWSIPPPDGSGRPMPGS